MRKIIGFLSVENYQKGISREIWNGKVFCLSKKKSCYVRENKPIMNNTFTLFSSNLVDGFRERFREDVYCGKLGKLWHRVVYQEVESLTRDYFVVVVVMCWPTVPLVSACNCTFYSNLAGKYSTNALLNSNRGAQ